MPDRDVESRSSRTPDWRRRAAEAPVTTALISLCVVTFALTLVLVGTLAEDPLSALIHSLWSIDSDAGLVQLGALELSRVWLDGDWWRLLTAAFLHGSWLHLLLNLSALWSIGEWLEPAIGSRKTLAIFLIAALGGSLASLVWCEAPVVVGASGGILGLAGALLYTRLFFSSASAIENLPSPTTAATDSVPSIVLPARSTPAASSASSDSSIPAARAASADTASLRDLREISAPSLAIMIALCLGLGLVVPMIAQAGHVGGLITGVLATITLLKRGRWRFAAVFALFALFAYGYTSGRAPSGRSNYHLFLGYHYQRENLNKQALGAFEAALELAPEDPSLANAVAYNLSLAGHDLAHADQLVDQALADEPENADYLDTKGWIACRRGEVEDGMMWLRRAQSASEKANPEILEHLETCTDAMP